MSRLFAFFVALASGFGVYATWRAFVTTASGQRIEAAAHAGATFGQNRAVQLAEPVLEVVSLSFVVIAVAVAMGIALLRRRWALALQAAALVLGANVATQVLKRLVFYRPDLDGSSMNTLPSGHTTVAAAFAAALVLVAPPWARPLLAIVGAAYAAATGVATLVLQWHRPSDVMAAILVVLTVASLLCAVGPWSEADAPPARVRGRTPTPDGRAHVVGTAVAAGALSVAAVSAAVPAFWGISEAYEAVRAGAVVRQVPTYLAGVAGVISLSAAAFALLLLVRHVTARPRRERPSPTPRPALRAGPGSHE